jgi:hypothetical protein
MIDPAAVIADENAQVFGGIFQFDFDALRPGVTKGIN